MVKWRAGLECQGRLEVIALNTLNTEYVILYMGICSLYGVAQTQTAFLNSNFKLNLMSPLYLTRAFDGPRTDQEFLVQLHVQLD